jgi:DNA-binding IclR family transcriptional regulator
VAGNSKDHRRSVVSKVSAILWAMTAGGANTLTEIAVRSELSLSTVHRLATELTAWGVLERDTDGPYRAGAPLRALGCGVQPGAVSESESRLREYAAPVLEDLFRETGTTVRAGYLDGGAVAYVEKVSVDTPVSLFAAAARLPAHATALGKVLLAFSPPAMVNGVLARELVPYTCSTITCPRRLSSDLRTIRLLRIATCQHELRRGWCSVAAPVFGPGGNVLAAVELRVADARKSAAARSLLTVAATGLSRHMSVACRAEELDLPADTALQTG